MVFKKIYNNVKREYLFIFLVVLAALIIFNYFNDFNYTGLSVRESCYEKGYSCCMSGNGKDNYYFSLDNTCSAGQECWDYCGTSNQNNLITTKASFIDSINNFFKEIKNSIQQFFSRGAVGSCVPNTCSSGDYTQICKSDGSGYESCGTGNICLGKQCIIQFCKGGIVSGDCSVFDSNCNGAPDGCVSKINEPGCQPRDEQCIDSWSCQGSYSTNCDVQYDTKTCSAIPRCSLTNVEDRITPKPFLISSNSRISCDQGNTAPACDSLGSTWTETDSWEGMRVSGGSSGYCTNQILCKNTDQNTKKYEDFKFKVYAYESGGDCSGQAGAGDKCDPGYIDLALYVTQQDEGVDGDGDFVNFCRSVRFCGKPVTGQKYISDLEILDGGHSAYDCTNVNNAPDCITVTKDGGGFKKLDEFTSMQVAGGSSGYCMYKKLCGKEKIIAPPIPIIPVCGNGIREPQMGEECDGNDIVNDCYDLGSERGDVACTTKCKLDVRGCDPSISWCNNEILDGGEDCDKSNLNGQTCISKGFAGGGTLLCNSDCAFNTAQCTSSSPPCGNGVIEGLEQCDNGIGNGVCPKTCSSTCTTNTCGDTKSPTISNIQSTPTKDSAKVTWKTDEDADSSIRYDIEFDDLVLEIGTALFPSPNDLDNNHLVTISSLQPDTTYYYIIYSKDASGNKAKSISLSNKFKTLKGISSPNCGNSIIDAGEDCDTSNLNGQTCISKGYLGGTLLCSPRCVFDTNQCVNIDLPKPTSLSAIVTDKLVSLTWKKLPSTGSGQGESISGNVVYENFFQKIPEFFKNLFKKQSVGAIILKDFDNYKISRTVLTGQDKNNQKEFTLDLSNCQNNICTFIDDEKNFLNKQSSVEYGVYPYSAAYGSYGYNSLITSSIRITKPIISSFSIAEGNNVKSESVTLNINTQYAYQCKYANSQSDLVSANYESYSTTRIWALTSGQGQKEVYAQCRNLFGESTSLKATTFLQTKGENEYGDSNVVCRDNIDNDGDGVYDGLDKDCAIGEKVNIQSIILQDNKPFEGSDFELQCKIAISPQLGGTATLARAETCIIANISKGSQSQICEFLKRTNDIIRFKCDAGSKDNNKVASCRVDTTKCNGDAVDLTKNIAQKYINITNPGLCSREIGQERLSINNIDLDDKTYERGDKIKPSLDIENLDNEDLDVVVNAYLYDINKKQQLLTTSQNKVIVQGLNEETFNLELITPRVPESKYKLYFKTYLKGQENEICLTSSSNIQIEPSSNQSVSNVCGNGILESREQCDDGNNINGDGCNSICNLENNLTQSCANGEVRECGSNIGICKKGTQACVNRIWARCSGNIEPSQEICDNLLDDNCNGLTDCSDSACSSSSSCKNNPGGTEDTDNDGLLDSWELKYFGNLLQNASDDFDKDGFTNIEEYSATTDPADSSSIPNKSSTITIVAVVVLVLLIVGFLVWMFVFKPKNPSMPDLSNKPLYMKKSTQSSTNTNSSLSNYIRSSIKRGYTKQQIKNALMMKGWSEKEIDEAFKKV